MTFAQWLLFCGVSLLMCFTPGPAVLLAVSNSVDVGARRWAAPSASSRCRAWRCWAWARC